MYLFSKSFCCFRVISYDINIIIPNTTQEIYGMNSANAFIEKVKTDETLLFELAALAEKEDAQGMAKLMRTNGVSEKGLASLIHLDQAGAGSDGELSDESLEGVSAGGVWEAICNGVYLLTQ